MLLFPGKPGNKKSMNHGFLLKWLQTKYEQLQSKKAFIVSVKSCTLISRSF